MMPHTIFRIRSHCPVAIPKNFAVHCIRKGKATNLQKKLSAHRYPHEPFDQTVSYTVVYHMPSHNAPTIIFSVVRNTCTFINIKSIPRLFFCFLQRVETVLRLTGKQYPSLDEKTVVTPTPILSYFRNKRIRR